METELFLHPEARVELLEAARWYHARNRTASQRFRDAVRQGVQTILLTPQTFPNYLHGTRKYVLKKFPYLIVYRELLGGIQIIAVAHGRRRPGYWKDRL